MAEFSVSPACPTSSIRRVKKPPLSRTPRLYACPYARGSVVSIFPMSPKKPNSAIRRVAKVSMSCKLNRHRRVTARMPGEGYLAARFHRVLIRGGRANDLPGVGYSLVRAAKHTEFGACFGRTRSPSLYGLGRPETERKVRETYRADMAK